MKTTLKSTILLIGCLILTSGLLAQDTALVLRAASVDPANASTLISPDAAAWSGIQAKPIHLNRTPPLYTGDQLDDGYRPTATAQFARVGDDVLVRVTWTDSTADVSGNGKKYPDAGAEHIYPQQTEHTAGFADALCIMVPQKRGPHASYPSMMMGDAQEPVDLFFWRAGEGFSLLGAHGRETVDKVANAPVEGGEVRQDGGWSVVMKLPDLSPRTPICFAVWDGNREQRDGLKYFSLWYEIE